MKSYVKSLLALALLQVLPLGAQAAEELVVYKKNVSTAWYSIFLSEKPVISFGDDGITLSTKKNLDVTLTSLKYTEVAKLEFIENDSGHNTPTTDIEEAEELHPAALRMSLLDGNTVVFDGVADQERTAIYGIDGRSAAADVERSSDRVTFHLSSLPKGIYIIRVGSQSFKIYKKL